MVTFPLLVFGALAILLVNLDSPHSQRSASIGYAGAG